MAAGRRPAPSREQVARPSGRYGDPGPGRRRPASAGHAAEAHEGPGVLELAEVADAVLVDPALCRVEDRDLLVADHAVDVGLTGVVGPNGCGKSNLVEAIRWVMGESSFKSLRASGMDDVIFAGSSGRPPREVAEVALQIDNRDRTAPNAFNDVDDLDVARRIKRDGGSVYRVNGREVRARDVQLLFADAATGARSPAMVRQVQRVDSVPLSAARSESDRDNSLEVSTSSSQVRAMEGDGCAGGGGGENAHTLLPLRFDRIP